MNKDEVEKLIDTKIRRHEFNVTLVSGAIGGIIVGGLAHATWVTYSLASSVQ
jgi:hypothetical protein